MVSQYPFKMDSEMHLVMYEAHKHMTAPWQGTVPRGRARHGGWVGIPPLSLCCPQSTGAAGRRPHSPARRGIGAAACE